MKTLNRITEEFVRHYRRLIDVTGDDPSTVSAALEEHPELAASIERLHETVRAVERHRYFSPRRFIVQAHPEFRRTVNDVRQRWGRAYGHLWEHRCKKAALSISDEFVRCYLILKEVTGDDPTVVECMRVQDSKLESAIRHLDEIAYALDEPQDYAEEAKSFTGGVGEFSDKTREIIRVIAFAPPAFRGAFRDYAIRWAGACAPKVETDTTPINLDDLLFDLDQVEDETACNDLTINPGDSWLKDLIDNIPDLPKQEDVPSDSSELRSFDPSRDSSADTIMRAEDFYEQKQEWERYEANRFDEYRCDEAFRWMHETVGLNLYDIEKRWKEFPVIVVQQHVSDQYGLEEPRGLYGYLSQVRLAYMIGADLAAVALCRSVTELLIRYHYACALNIPGATVTKGKGRQPLGWLIERVQNNAVFTFLSNFNLSTKIDDANEILHQPAGDIEHRDRARGLVIQWVMCLEEMIDRAPARGVTVCASTEFQP